MGRAVDPGRSCGVHRLLDRGHYDYRVTWPRILTALAVVVSLFGISAPATATDSSSLAAQIDQISPTNLAGAKTVEVTGKVTNTGTTTWTDVQAYLVMPRTGFTSRADLEEVIAEGTSYTGTRIVDVGRFAELGVLAPQAAKKFTIKVPISRLGLTGASGVYPAGVQILATDYQGVRSNDAVAKATTFIPLVSDPSISINAGLIWPFTVTDDIAKSTPLQLAKSTNDGRLRRYLNAAAKTPSAGRTVVLDPALIDLLGELLNGEVASAAGLNQTQVSWLDAWLTDLRSLTSTSASWVLGYGRPDELALSRHQQHATKLLSRVSSATDSTLSDHSFSGTAVTWPTPAGATAKSLALARDRSTGLILLSRSTVSAWSQDLGSAISVKTSAGDAQVIVDSSLAKTPGKTTPATLRQQVLTDAALALFSRKKSPSSRADALTFVDPDWDPGSNAGRAFTTALTAAGSAGLTKPTTAADLLNGQLTQYTGQLPKTVSTKSLSGGYLSQVAAWSELASRFDSVVVNNSNQQSDREIAAAISVNWRKNQTQARKLAVTETARLESKLSQIRIETPSAITLSSTKGSFPLTIANDTESAIRVGIRLSADNPGIRFGDIDVVRIAAGDRHTVTVEADLGEQNSSTVSAFLVTPLDQQFGQDATFNVRSSKVGLIGWLAMAAAGLLFVATWARRFLGKRRARE